MEPVSPEAQASVEITVEPVFVFDCGDIVGSAFDNLNRNGYRLS